MEWTAELERLLNQMQQVETTELQMFDNADEYIGYNYVQIHLFIH